MRKINTLFAGLLKASCKFIPLFSLLILLALVFSINNIIFAQTPTPSDQPSPQSSVSGDELKKLQNQIKEYEQKVTDLQSQAKTLASQIAIMDNQIRLTELRINETRQRIANILKDVKIAKGKIILLENEINVSTKALLGRIIAVYKVGRTDPWQVFLTSDSNSNFMTRLSYLRFMEMYDKKNIYSTEQARVDYANQKSILEDKQKEEELLKQKLEAYTNQLNNEKIAKQDLLEVTKNDEKKYQELLARARAEYEAIQGIVAGKGDEIFAKKVGEGEKIASIIQGSSCNSSGTHLHFIVSTGGNAQNPFNYLKSGIDYQNCSGAGECSVGDPFNPSGSWNWPVDPPVKFVQGYGSTWAVQHTWVGQVYNFHNGIDILSDSSADIKAVKSGSLYRGSYGGSRGCRLRYVKVVHDEGGIDTYYLHINYL